PLRQVPDHADEDPQVWRAQAQEVRQQKVPRRGGGSAQALHRKGQARGEPLPPVGAEANCRARPPQQGSRAGAQPGQAARERDRGYQQCGLAQQQVLPQV
ncbi:hypothetical protein IWW38_004763, partial [Coemansia aciculifera]